MQKITTHHASSVHDSIKFEPPFVYIPKKEAMKWFGVESESTWNYLVRTKELPTPYKIGKRLTGFRSDQLTECLLNRKKAYIMEVA